MEEETSKFTKGFLSLPAAYGKGAPLVFGGAGEDVYEWIEEFEIVIQGAGLTEAEKCKASIRYWDREEARLVRLQPEFKKGDWEALKKKILDLYPSPIRSFRHTAADRRCVRGGEPGEPHRQHV